MNVYQNMDEKIEKRQAEVTKLFRFAAVDAFELGSLARIAVIEKFPNRPAVINITMALGQVVFHSITPTSGTNLDNDTWIKRKVASVLRFDCLTLYLGFKLNSKGKRLEDANYCPEETYATHGGGVPIRINGVDGAIGALVVSGLKQDEDHHIAITALEQYLARQQRGDI